MVRAKMFARGLAVLCPALIVGLAVPGCGGDDNATGSQVKDVSPEARQQIQQTISKTYSKDYKEKYSSKKR